MRCPFCRLEQWAERAGSGLDEAALATLLNAASSAVSRLAESPRLTRNGSERQRPSDLT
jgi:hypothetical protein